MDTFTALSDLTRRNIIELLSEEGPLSATEIYSKFKSTPSAISQHLKILNQTNLVKVEKQAQKRLYSVNYETLSQVENWVRQINSVWYDRFNRLEEILNN